MIKKTHKMPKISSTFRGTSGTSSRNPVSKTLIYSILVESYSFVGAFEKQNTCVPTAREPTSIDLLLSSAPPVSMMKENRYD
jgi:hypothetical protein